MDFKILYGRAGSGKTHRCVEEIKKRTASGEKCIMIVPEQFSYRTEKLLVGALGATSSETTEALTFTRMAGRIFSQKSGAVKLPLSGAGKNMLIYRAVTAVKKLLATYSLAADKVGFADKIASLISELKRYGISSGDVADLSEKVENHVLAAKLADIALIYGKYDELFLEDYSDYEDNLYIAAQLLEQSSYLEGVHIFIDEFTDFLPQHYKMLEALCGRAASVTVCLCADKSLGTQGLFAASAKTFFKLKDMCMRAGINFCGEYLDGNMLHRGNDEFLYLEKNYAKIGAVPYEKKTENIKIFESLNVYSEIENAAREILRTVREKRVRWRDIVVCCGDADTYFEPVKIVFGRYGIPCFLSEKSAVSSHPLVLTLLSAIDILISGYSYEVMFTYLKTGFANVSAHEADMLENYVLATGASKKAWLDEKPWSYKSDFSQEQAQVNVEIDEIRRRVTEPLVRLRENIGSKHTVSHACEAVYRFACELGMGEKTQKLIDDFKAEGDLVNANKYSRIWNGIMNILDQAVLIAGEQRIGMEQFKNLLEAGFLKEQMGIIPQSADAVSVVDVSNARAAECEYMFALGTNTGRFAMTSVSEGILTDREREMLENMGTELAPTSRAASFDAGFLIYKAVAKPQKQLYLSYAISNMSGEAMAESEVCKNIKSIFPLVVTEDDLTEDNENERLLASPEATFGELAMHLGGGVHETDGFWRQVYGWYKARGEYSERLERLSGALSYKNAAQTLLKEQTDRLYPHGVNTSVSRLERYSRCPFSYFIEYTLKAKERKILKIGAPDIGSIMHAVLERFTKLIENDEMSWNEIDDRYISSSISAIVDELCADIFRGSAVLGKPTQYILLRLKRNLIRCSKLLVKHIASGSFEPVGSEVRFGDGGKIDAVIVDLSSGKKLKIRGVIDRIDKCETPEGTYYRIIDYKSGKKSFSLENVYNGLDLQLVVYLEAAMQKKKDAKPAGMLYFHIHEPMKNAARKMSEQEAETELNKMMRLDGLVLNDERVIRSMDRNLDSGSDFLPVSMTKSGEIRITKSLATMNQFGVLLKYVKGALKKIGDGIAGGNIDIMPCRSGDSSPCAYCAYKCVCKFDVTKEKNSYRICESAGAGELWEMMNKGGGNGGGKLDR